MSGRFGQTGLFFAVLSPHGPQHWIVLSLLAAILSTLPTSVALAQATWTSLANGQEFSCIHEILGPAPYSWPDNDLWSQQQVDGTDPCGNPAVRQPSNWSTLAYPDNGNGGANYDVVIGAPTPTILDLDVTIDSLTIAAGGDLAMEGRASIDIATSGGLTNNGQLTIAAATSIFPFPTGTETGLTFAADAAINGSGTILMNRGGVTVSEINTTGGATLTHGANHQILGRGRINAKLVNNGVIVADPAASEMKLILRENDKTNNHILQANVNGTLISELLIDGITLTQNNATGRIIANEGIVGIRGNANVVGGRLESVGDGFFRVGILQLVEEAATLTNVTLEGTLNVDLRDTLTIAGSGITNNGQLKVASNFMESGVIFANSGSLAGTGTLELASNSFGAQLNAAAGAVITNEANHTIKGRGQINADVINQGLIRGDPGGQLLEINGTVSGTGLLKDVRIDGTHAPGASTAAVPIQGVYTVANSGTLQMEIGGTTASSEYDQLLSTGIVNLDGTLEVSMLDLGNSYVPSAGDQFDIITSTTTINGMFDTANLPTSFMGQGLTWLPVDYSNPLKVVLKIASAGLAGDYNGNGIVDAADYTVWLDALGGTTLLNESASPGIVDAADYAFWKANFGATAGTGTSGDSSVPEPGSLLLLLASAGTAILSHKRSSRCVCAVSRQ